MVAKMHRMHLPKVGEGVIHIPGGVPFEADDPPKFPPGAYMRLGNKEFIYAIAGGTLNTDLGAMNATRQIVAQRTIAVTAKAGATEVSANIGADGVAGNGAIAKDELAGGEAVFFPVGMTNSFTRGIIGNTKTVTTGDVMVITLDSPIPVDIGGTDVVAEAPYTKIECIPSPYANVQTLSNDWTMVMGMPTVVAKIGQGLWLQVSGPSWAAPAGEVGAGAKDLEVVFVGNGSLALRGATTNVDCQHAGVVIATPVTPGQGAPFIMLQIAH